MRGDGEAAVRVGSPGPSYPTKDVRQAWECVVCERVRQASRNLEVTHC